MGKNALRSREKRFMKEVGCPLPMGLRTLHRRDVTTYCSHGHPAGATVALLPASLGTSTCTFLQARVETS